MQSSALCSAAPGMRDVPLALWEQSKRVSMTVDAGPVCQSVFLRNGPRKAPSDEGSSISSRCSWPQTGERRCQIDQVFTIESLAMTVRADLLAELGDGSDKKG